MECRGFAVDAEWVTAMVAGWLGDGYGGWVWLHSVPETPSYGTEYACRAQNRPPVVRDASSEAFGVKNRLLWYGRDIRYQKRPPTVRNCASVIAFYDVWKEATGCSLQGHN